MISTLEQVSRKTCVICDLRSNPTLRDTCESENRGDFYRLLLTKFKDECDNYFDLQAKCIDMHDAIEHCHVPDTPLMMFA